MAKEIERKFLVNRTKWRKAGYLEAFATKSIVQGYLSRNDKHSIRVRLHHSKDSGYEASLTVKGKQKGFTRDEFEYNIPLADYYQMFAMCDSSIEKTRHYVQMGKHLWEVDEFFGVNKGLLVAEIELKDEKDAFSNPPWLGKEVTHDKRYTNAYLSVRKAPK